MQTVRTLFTRLVLYLLVLAAGTYVVLFVLEFAAIPIAPLQTYLACPQGTSLQTAWVQETWDQPGQTTLVKSCMDAGGVEQPAFSDLTYNQRQYNLFLPFSFVIMLLIEVAWLVVSALRGRVRQAKAQA